MKKRHAYCWGQAAEAQIAARYADQGGTVVARRLRTPGGELDLVVAFRNVLVFVEVKARRSLEAALGALAEKQVARLRSAASCFLAEQGAGGDRDVRFDLAAVGGDGRVEIVENALIDGMA